MTIDRLFVIWRHPASGARDVVGDLWRTDDGFAFAYRSGVPHLEGFTFQPEFPELRLSDRPYRAPYLFATFAQRVPSPARADRSALMAAWGVQNPDDALEVLARSGGIQMTDRLELAEYRPDVDQLDQPLEMRIAGASHHDASALTVGDPLELRRERDNAYDANATLVVFRGTDKVGYVPRQYSAMIARLLDRNVALRAEAVRKLVLPPQGGRWVVRVARDSRHG